MRMKCRDIGSGKALLAASSEERGARSTRLWKIGRRPSRTRRRVRKRKAGKSLSWRERGKRQRPFCFGGEGAAGVWSVERAMHHGDGPPRAPRVGHTVVPSQSLTSQVTVCTGFRFSYLVLVPSHHILESQPSPPPLKTATDRYLPHCPLLCPWRIP